MTLLTLFILNTSCHRSLAPIDEKDEDATKMLSQKIEDYHNGDWKAWVQHYADTARIFYNTRTAPMSPSEAAYMHEISVVPLSKYQFDDDMLIEKIHSIDGSLKLLFKGYWKATLAENGKTFETPSLVYYKIVGGKIVEEHGFWDNTIYAEAYQEMISERNQ